MISYDEQIRIFKNSIPIGPKGVDEMVAILRSEVDIEKIELHSTPGQTMRNAIFNASHCIDNFGLQVAPENMVFSTFKITRNEKSEIYYQDIPEYNEFIYMIFEKFTGYLISNSNLLFVKMELVQGVSQQEFDTNGLKLQALLSHLAALAMSKNIYLTSCE